jgi:formylglycine-generating enzyme required for sulfatase activity
MKRSVISGSLGAALMIGLVSTAWAGFPKSPVKTCAENAIVAGTVCLDKYEASVWRVPNATTLNAELAAKIKQGKATTADLSAGGASLLGTGSDDYAPCADNGQNCANDIYALSLPGVVPSAFITWFQAQLACANAGKRLPTSAEWQAGVLGTPDTGGADNGTTNCNTDNLAPGVTGTGFRTGCVSASGAFDMVGNLYEWVADWVPRSTACPGWGGFSDDLMCLSGASTTAPGPGALLRGGYFSAGSAGSTNAGPLTVDGSVTPSVANGLVGFRCAR